MSSPAAPLRLLTVQISSERDVVLARQRARQLAAALGFDRQHQTRIATAISEVARNAFQYAGGGRLEFSVQTDPHPAKPRQLRQTFRAEVRDRGPGISQLEEILSGNYRSSTGMGIGLAGTHRLMDRVQIETSPAGTAVTMAKVLPPTAAPRSPTELQAIVDRLAQEPQAGAIEEVQVQNQELLAALQDAHTQQEELARLNQELAETNTGVLALYDELETLHRISVMLASKLELKPLIQSIIEVTTSLTDAELGAFFLREEPNGGWVLYASAGSRMDALADLGPSLEEDFFGPDFVSSGIEHIPDFSAHPQPCCGSRFAGAIARRLVVASCLTVPVKDAVSSIGAFVFASSKPRNFTERGERILTSVATQTAVGIEKARLFQSVSAASDAKDRFFATLSHELRTPLNPALAIISSLQGDPRVPPELLEDIVVAARNIRLEARLIDDLLDFNRLIKGKLQLTTSPVDLHTLIKSAVSICREELDAKRQHLETNLRASHSVVVGDAARLQQVLWNVLKNAIKFTPADGWVRIETVESGGALEVRISDTGLGIEADALERIFRAFDQGQANPAHFGGLGLGLSIARMFVELHGGRIAAASPGPGQGATITIALPLPVEPLPAGAAAERTLAAPGSRHGRILLVDDHHDTLRTLARLLTRRGFQVTPAANAAEAVALARQQGFDLLVSDLGLPDCSGLQLVAMICEIQRLPAIALSGYGMEADLMQSKDAGFDLHITKPVDFEQLLAGIDRLLQPPGGPTNAAD